MIVPAVTPADRDALLMYMAGKIGSPPADLVGTMPFAAMVVKRGERDVGALLYTNYRGSTVEMLWAGEPGWLTRGIVRAMWQYPFLTLGCSAVIGTIRRHNRRSRELAERMGCKVVGVIEGCYGDNDDGILYVMPKRSCRWIEGGRLNG